MTPRPNNGSVVEVKKVIMMVDGDGNDDDNTKAETFCSTES